jgi:hypothetical protein
MPPGPYFSLVPIVFLRLRQRVGRVFQHKFSPAGSLFVQAPPDLAARITEQRLEYRPHLRCLHPNMLSHLFGFFHNQFDVILRR